MTQKLHPFEVMALIDDDQPIMHVSDEDLSSALSWAQVEGSGVVAGAVRYEIERRRNDASVAPVAHRALAVVDELSARLERLIAETGHERDSELPGWLEAEIVETRAELEELRGNWKP